MTKLIELLKRLFSKPNISVIFFISFLVFNALKVTLFNAQLIVHPLVGYLFWRKFAISLSLVSLVFILCSRSRILLGLAYFLQWLYLFINLAYYLSFNDFLHIGQYFSLAKEGLAVVFHSAVPFDQSFYFLFWDLPLFFGVLYLQPKVVFKKMLILFSMIVLITFQSINCFVNLPPWVLARDSFASQSEIVFQYGILGLNFTDFLRLKSDEDLIASLQYGPTVISKDQKKSQPNFILIQVESLDAHIVDYKYKGKYVTPFLHQLSQESLFYPYVFSFHKVGGSSDCEFSLLNSVEPLYSASSLKLRRYDYPNSLVKQLNKNGYQTLAFHDNEGDFFNRNIVYPKLGFAQFFDMFSMKLKARFWGGADHDMFDFITTRLQTQVQPFFYYIITMSSHPPFEINDYYSNEQYADISDPLLRNYLNAMTYVDEALKKFLIQVKANCDNTMVLILGDHAAHVLKKESFPKSSLLIEENNFEFVPLFIITPDQQVYREKVSIGSFLDIAPTVLFASGIDFKIRTAGLNLLEYPLPDNNISYKGTSYQRNFLRQKVADYKKNNG